MSGRKHEAHPELETPGLESSTVPLSTLHERSRARRRLVESVSVRPCRSDQLSTLGDPSGTDTSYFLVFFGITRVYVSLRGRGKRGGNKRKTGRNPLSLLTPFDRRGTFATRNLPSRRSTTRHVYQGGKGRTPCCSTRNGVDVQVKDRKDLPFPFTSLFFYKVSC